MAILKKGEALTRDFSDGAARVASGFASHVAVCLVLCLSGCSSSSDGPSREPSAGLVGRWLVVKKIQGDPSSSRAVVTEAPDDATKEVFIFTADGKCTIQVSGLSDTATYRRFDREGMLYITLDEDSEFATYRIDKLAASNMVFVQVYDYEPVGGLIFVREPEGIVGGIASH